MRGYEDLKVERAEAESKSNCHQGKVKGFRPRSLPWIMVVPQKDVKNTGGGFGERLTQPILDTLGLRLR